MKKKLKDFYSKVQAFCAQPFGRFFWPVWWLCFLLLSLRLQISIGFWSVNVPFMDQWDIYRGFFEDYSWWESFRIQHASHRQGLGAIFSNALAKLSGMNLHWENRGMGVLLSLSALFASFWVYKKMGRTSLLLFLIPVLILNLSQYEVFAGAPNPAHGILPQMLFFLLACALFVVGNTWLRHALLLAISFLILHTGFGYLFGPCLLLWAALKIFQKNISKRALFGRSMFLFLCVGVISIFLVNYQMPHGEGQQSGLAVLGQIPAFMVALVSRGLGASRVNLMMLPAAFILVGLVYLFFRSAFRILQGEDLNRTESVVFLGSSLFLLFAAASAFGRGSMGLGAAISSRYVPFVSLALVFYFVGIFSRAHSYPIGLASVILALVFIAQEFRPRGRDSRVASEYRNAKLEFADCYRRHNDFHMCNGLLLTPIYPPEKAQMMPSRLELLEERKWSFFGSAL